MPLGGDGSWVLMVGVDGCWLMPMVDGLIIPATMRSLLMFDVDVCYDACTVVGWC